VSERDRKLQNTMRSGQPDRERDSETDDYTTKDPKAQLRRHGVLGTADGWRGYGDNHHYAVKLVFLRAILARDAETITLKAS